MRATLFAKRAERPLNRSCDKVMTDLDRTRKETTMAKFYWYAEQDEFWEDGCFIRTTKLKPIERQEAELLREALELKELARAQQKLLDHYRNEAKTIDGQAVRVPVRAK
jgi:hypothetical protein